LLAEATQYRQKGDNKAALIQLKNAASKSPEDAEVRFALAALYNTTGDPLSAEKEIRKAISLGVDAARTAPELAKALQMQGQPQKAIDETEAEASKASPELLAIRGDAYLALGDNVKSKQSYERALAAKPGHAEALFRPCARLRCSGKMPMARCGWRIRRSRQTRRKRPCGTSRARCWRSQGNNAARAGRLQPGDHVRRPISAR
jgi:Tfp pilus assembly protein PilF